MDNETYKVTDDDLQQLKGMLDPINLTNFNGTFTTKLKISLLVTIIIDKMIKSGKLRPEEETGLIFVKHDVLYAIEYIRAPDGIIATEILR